MTPSVDAGAIELNTMRLGKGHERPIYALLGLPLALSASRPVRRCALSVRRGLIYCTITRSASQTDPALVAVSIFATILGVSTLLSSRKLPLPHVAESTVISADDDG